MYQFPSVFGVPSDKVGHFVLGLIGYICVRLVTGSPIYAVFVVAFLGAAKEVWDRFNPPHKAEWLDFVADMTAPLIFFTAEYIWSQA